MKTTSKISQFFCDYFEDLLAPIIFAKIFGFLAGVVFKIFAIENALQSQTQFLRNAFGKSSLLHYHNNRAQKVVSRNRIRVCFYTYISVFFPRSTFQNFFSKVNSLKTYCAYFFRVS